MSQPTGNSKDVVVRDDDENITSAQTKLLFSSTKTGLSLITSWWEYKLTAKLLKVMMLFH